MLLNKLEFHIMNSPFRAYIQDKLEIKRLRDLSSLPPGKIVLEIGCGNGMGTKLIKKYFSPKKIFAIDLDKRMVKLAEEGKTDSSICFEVCDVSSLKYKSNQFDAVFNFGIIHHIPNWKDSLKELKRVLKTGGELILEDLSKETFNTFLGRKFRKFLKHPYEKMYKRNEFVDYLRTMGFEILEERSYYPACILKYFVVIAKK